MAHDDDNERFDEQGVDLTLVRYTLGLTPTERLKALENFMNAMASVRRPAPLNDAEASPRGDERPADEPPAGEG